MKINVKFPELYDAQLEVAKACFDKRNKYIVLNGSRQVGKTWLLCTVAIYWALSKPKQTLLIISPTDDQVSEVQNRIIQMLGQAIHSIVKRNKIQSGKAETVFINNSRILYRSAGSETSLRGKTVNKLLIDEAAFIKEQVWTDELGPMLSSVKDPQVYFSSTPKGKNFFAQLYSRGINGEPNISSHKITYHQNPYANIEYINGKKRELPAEIFAQEYLGEFIDSFSVFKNTDELAVLKPQKPDTKYHYNCTIGIDIAFQTDYTVAVCIDSDGNMLDYIRFNQVEAPEAVNKLSKFINDWQPKKTIIELNNQGLPIYHLLKAQGIYNLEGFTTTPETKKELINDLIASFQKKEIKILNDQILKEEFRAFTYALSKTGKVQFAAAYGHDDIVLATSFAWLARSKSGYRPIAFM